MYIPIFIIKKASFLTNSHQRLTLASHWSVPCQIASHSCKGTWKREYLAGHIGVLYEADVVLARQKGCLTLARQSTVSTALGYSNLECLGQEKVEKLMVQHILMQAGAAWSWFRQKEPKNGVSRPSCYSSIRKQYILYHHLPHGRLMAAIDVGRCVFWGCPLGACG